MRQGFVKVAAVTPKIRVADTGYNAKVICQAIKEAADEGAKVIVLPELCITGYTCGDLFLQEKLLREAKNELINIAKFTADIDAIVCETDRRNDRANGNKAAFYLPRNAGTCDRGRALRGSLDDESAKHFTCYAWGSSYRESLCIG